MDTPTTAVDATPIAPLGICTVTWDEPDTDLGGTGFIPSRVHAQQDINAYLASRQLRIGQRLPHAMCPIDPGHQSHAAHPVIILPGGFYCHSCKARLGIGLVTWNRILSGMPGTVAPTGIDILECARHFTFFSHVCYVMCSAVATSSTTEQAKVEAWCKLVYAALLKYAHPDLDITSNDLHARIFRQVPFVRGGGFWQHADTLLPVGRSLSVEVCKALSSSRIPVGGTPGTPAVDSAPDPIRVEQHLQDGAIPGFPELVPVLGAPIYFCKNRSPGAHCIRVAPRQTRDRVTYLPVAERMSDADIHEVLTSVYIGFDLRYCELLMAAKGVAECGFGPLPEIFTHGVSGSQKTGNIIITAAALGDHAFNLATQKVDNFGEAIGTGSRGASYVYDDEVFKQVQDFAHSPLRPILLSMNRDYDYRKLHTGSVKVPMTSAIVLCDTDKPDDLDQDEQFGRRYIYNPMTERVPDWRATRIDWKEFWRHTPEHRRAFCSLYSRVVDTYFYEGSRMGFHEIAGALGYSTLEKYRLATETGKHLQERIIDVFWAVIRPGDTLPEEAHQGRGWRLVPSGEEAGDHPIARALEALGVQSCSNTHRAIELVKRQDGRWRDLVGATYAARCETRDIRGKRYIRFVHGETKGMRVNEELVPQARLLERFPDLVPAA